jgi:hypothetical protein
MILVPSIDPCILDSIFPAPGRNEPCHCGSGLKYKRCHEPLDQVAWRALAARAREAAATLAFLRTMPKSRHPEYDPS